MQITVYSSSDESDVPIKRDDIPEDESSEDESSEPDITDLLVGGIVIVNFKTKQTSYHYIGMVENLRATK